MSSTSIMKVTGNGQVSIPAATRSRWNAERVIVVDLGDRVVMRPLPDDPVRDLRGKYKDRLPTSDSIRQEDRQLDAADEAGE
jgi:bifunctional DNA-binding transcriptional regulator/antitoxin component of YhaV-PrlF toxin-antitoxin module